MSLGTPTINGSYFQAPSQPTFVDDISFALDASYPANGYTGLPAALQAAFQSASYPFPGQQPRTIVDILGQADLSGYVAVWDQVHQSVRIFQCASAGNPLAEVTPGTDLHTVTLRLRVLSA